MRVDDAEPDVNEALMPDSTCHGRAGSEQKFVLQACDMFGNNRSGAADVVAAVLTKVDLFVPADVEGSTNGMHCTHALHARIACTHCTHALHACIARTHARKHGHTHACTHACTHGRVVDEWVIWHQDSDNCRRTLQDACEPNSLNEWGNGDVMPSFDAMPFTDAEIVR